MAGAEITCTYHPGYDINKFCRACSLEPVCDVCCKIGNSHHNHKTSKIDEIYAECKAAIETYRSQEMKTLQLLKSKLSDIEICVLKSEKHVESIKIKILERGEELKTEIDKVVKYLTSCCTNLLQQYKGSKTKIAKQLETDQSIIEDNLTRVNELLQRENKMKIVTCSRTFSMKDMSHLSQGKVNILMEGFNLNPFTTENLEDLFGKLPTFEDKELPLAVATSVVVDTDLTDSADKILETNEVTHDKGNDDSKSTGSSRDEMRLNLTDVDTTSDAVPEILSPVCVSNRPNYILSMQSKIQTQFQHSSNRNICSISACTKFNQAWISFHAQKSVHLLNDKGIQLNSVSSDRVIKCICLSVLTGHIWMACSDRTIREHAHDSLNVLIKTPDYATCLCISSEEEVLVGMSGEATVIRYNRKGEIIKQLDRSRPGKQLVKEPQRIQENHDNGQIAIIDGNTNIIVLDKYMELIYRYHGDKNNEPNDNFRPSDICFDSGQNLVISDKEGKRVLLLDCSGRFLRVLFSDKLEPLALGIRAIDGLLWVGFGNKTVKIIRYLE